MSGFAGVERALEEAIALGVVPGAVLVCGQEGEVLVHQAWGCAARQPQSRPMRLDTLFDLASLTKVLATTLLAMKFCEAGRLDLDAALDAHLPGYYPKDKAALTPRQLLSHTAGLAAHLPLCEQYPPEPADPAAGRRAVLRQIHCAPLAYAPGSESRYSDLGPIILGALFEEREGLGLDRLCHRHLFAPLRLQHTFFVHLDAPLPHARRPAEDFAATECCPWRRRLICGQVHDENAYLLRGVAGHAGLFSSGGELALLARLLLDIHAGRSDFLRAGTLSAFTRRQGLVPGSSRALGWDTPSAGASCGRYFSPGAFGHTGFTGTSIWLDPERERFVVLLSNRVHPSRDNKEFLRFRPRLHDRIAQAMDAS